jgi:dienelactone hydrolase
MGRNVCPVEARLPGSGTAAWCFRPRGEPGAGLLMLPVTAGDYEVERGLARWLAGRGFTTLLVGRRAEWLAPGRMPAEIAAQAAGAHEDARLGIDWLLGPGGIDPRRLGLVGISLGAYLGSVVAGTDPRVRASVLLLGGADLAEALLTADDGFIHDWRASVASRLGVRPADLGPVLRAAIDPVDNRAPAAGIDPATTLMVFAAFDRVVIPRLGRLLWEAAHRPRRLLLPCGHYSAALFLPVIRLATAQWLDRMLRA